MRRAQANQHGGFAFLKGERAVTVGALALVLGAQRQPLHALHHADGGAGQAGKGLHIAQVNRRQALLAHRVKRQQAPGLFAHLHHAAHAVMHFQMALHALDQPVVGVGQRTVGGNAHRPIGRQQQAKARMLGNLESPAQRVTAQAINRQRHQAVAIKPQQGHGVTRQQGLHGLEQAAIAFTVMQLARQVIHQRHQGLQHGFGYQFDSFKYLFDYFS